MKKPNRLNRTVLNEDIEAFRSLLAIRDYHPQIAEFGLAEVTAVRDALEAAQNDRAHKDAAFEAAKDAEEAAEHRFHEALLGQRLDHYGRVSEVSEKAALTDLLIVERESGELIAGQEMLFVHVDIEARRPAAMRDPLKSMLAEWVKRQSPRISPLPYKRRLEFRR